jgi:hypothetical protein
MDGMDYDKFWQEYYADFHSRKEWNRALAGVGYEFVRYGNIKDSKKPNPTNYYYAMYRLKK